MLVGLLRLVCLLTMVGTYSSWSVIIDQPNVGIQFMMKYVLQQQFLYCFTCSSNQILILNIFSFIYLFFLDFFTYQLDFFLPQPLNLLPFSYQLSVRFWQFHVLLWMLWILVTVHKPCHVPHMPQITTWGTISVEICFDVPEEWVRSWSHVFVITKVKTLPRKLFEVRPQKVTRRKKGRIKTRMTIAKLSALNANN